MSDAPPTYEAAVGSSSSSSNAPQHQTRNGIPPERRRSMEDEARPLPSGWIRQYDPQNHHQFFVDTNKEPPRSIWHHPYDDEQYLHTLSPAEREQVTRLHRSVSLKDIEAESSDDDDHHHHNNKTSKKADSKAAAANQDPNYADVKGLHKFGRKIKDRVTHSTHQEREASREKRAREEQAAYQAHLAARRAMSRALETGQPQFLGKDRQGRDLYIEPPNGPTVPSGAYGYNPYSSGVYANSNARFLRPDYPYSRPYGAGWGT
ncbi:hypothetical protein K490DRAFT_57195 [Saccharata proteae CBS 121410]|uniref:WW domain-containing protein n=1 Tax=Saccharata proteae CBS 121410 TaxID=1314787 RepID=A0A9P4HXN3_9PEZI|nr:hypothetical protein K490DRAFT_57195 [Saccharata proteae CBS 121410]